MRATLWNLSAAASGGGVAMLVLAAGCGGGGGGGGKGVPVLGDDPVVVLSGPGGQLSRTIAEANADQGANPPPSIPPVVTSENHWIRLEFPVPIDVSTVLEDSLFTAPFSYLNGSITITDESGDHIPGLAMINGVDVFGVDRSAETGFPHDLQPDGSDKNKAENVFLYVADTDGDLSTVAAFGYRLDPLDNSRDEIKNSAQHENGSLRTVRVTMGEVNRFEFDAVWTFNIGTGAETRAPFVLRISSEIRDPTQPLNDASADIHSGFIVEFSEPLIPTSVGETAADGSIYYHGNMPRVPFVAPLPNVALTATVNSNIGTVFIPFDSTALNNNNLATYRIRPLIDLPAKTSIDVLVRALTANTNGTSGLGSSATDISGNAFDGQDANGDGTPDGVDHRRSFAVGPGPAFVNIPVSPEVAYWLPSAGDGIGAIDLNGRGLTTNTPRVNANDPDRGWIITKTWISPISGCEINPGGLNLANGKAHIGWPGSQATPTDPCTGLPMLQFASNRYWYPVGTGSYVYGPEANKARGQEWWAPNDPGNTGTPFPGVNEGSSGFETLCRDSNGEPILTGSEFGRVGLIQDLVVGEFLDVAYFDYENRLTSDFLHVTIWNSPVPHTQTGRGNSIADPPAPNPPPLRYWVGLPTLGVILDSAEPSNPALLLEGEEVFTGFRSASFGYQMLQPNPNDVSAADQTVFPHIGVGPGAQSASLVFTFSSRQQIGNFLYAADATSKEVHAINSNTMRVITSIPLPDPTGLSISPDLTRLYVSNASYDTVSIVGADPRGQDFHEEIAQIQVGSGPRAICVQPDNEDILVCNYLGDSVSIISTVNLSVRKTLDALISAPWDIESTPRQLEPWTNTTIGWACGVYFAYISNSDANSVVVYESGPDGPQGIGIDNVRGALPESDEESVILEPRGLCYSPFPNPTGLYAGGVFVAHRGDDSFGRVSLIEFTQQALFGPLLLVAPPGFFLPPGFLDRQFEITKTWGNTDANRLIGLRPTDVTLADFASAGYHANLASAAPNLGLLSVPPFVERTGQINSKHPMRLNTPACFPCVTPDRLYIAFEDTDSIQVVDPTQPGVLAGVVQGDGVGGVKKLMSYWRQ